MAPHFFPGREAREGRSGNVVASPETVVRYIDCSVQGEVKLMTTYLSI